MGFPSLTEPPAAPHTPSSFSPADRGLWIPVQPASQALPLQALLSPSSHQPDYGPPGRELDFLFSETQVLSKALQS